MTSSKLKRPKNELRDAISPRAIGDGDPDMYTREQVKTLIRYGLRYGRGLMKGREAANCSEQAEAFRRKCEIIWIFRGLPNHLRNRPSGQTTKNAVLDRLKKIGITTTERTLTRDYRALGGAKFLRDAKPFAPDEDRSSPFWKHIDVP